MTENNKNKEYIELINQIKKELPNIVLPSMGIFEEIKQLNIDSKDFLINGENEEEQIWNWIERGKH